MTATPTPLRDDLERALALLAKSDKLDRERVLGRVLDRHIDTVLALSRKLATPPASGEAGATIADDELPGMWERADLIGGATDATPPAASGDDEAFADWLAKEMPPSTVISNPRWWASRILRAARRLTAVAPAGMVLVPRAPSNCRERLLREGKPYPRSACAACGKFAPKWRDCEVLMAAESVAAGKE